MSELDERIREMLESVQRSVPPEPPFPLSPFRPREEIHRMRRVATTVLIGATVIGLWLAIVVLGRPPGDPSAPTVVGAPGPTVEAPADDAADGESTEVPSVIVAGVGPRVDQVLGGYQFDFFEATGYGLQVRAYDSPTEVWGLRDDPRSDVDVIEVGFRLDALGGLADEDFLPIDPVSIPALSDVPEWGRIDANGIVPGIDGALGLVHVPGSSEPPQSWQDLITEAERGSTVVVPGPPLSIAVVFVHALGEGDVGLGLSRYGTLIDASAVAARTTTEFEAALAGGATVGAWSSSGSLFVDRGVAVDVDFVVPQSGAIVLPAFTGIRRGAQSIEAALAWLAFRLGPPQSGMTFDGLAGRGPEPIPLTPVLDGHPTVGFTGIDPFAGDRFVALDWGAVAASRDEVTSRLEQILGG